MALIKEILGKTPKIEKNVFISETATIVGDVKIGENSSIWFNAVIRGDVNSIHIGKKVNIQDNVTVHCTFEKAKTIIGNRVSIGHNAIIHGCHLHDDVLVGMGAIIMDNCVVESRSIIAAGSVVTQGTHVKTGEVWAGIPARKIKSVSKELLEQEINRIADNYVKYSSWYEVDID